MRTCLFKSETNHTDVTVFTGNTIREYYIIYFITVVFFRVFSNSKKLFSYSNLLVNTTHTCMNTIHSLCILFDHNF